MLQDLLTDLTTVTAIAASIWVAYEFAHGLLHRRPSTPAETAPSPVTPATPPPPPAETESKATFVGGVCTVTAPKPQSLGAAAIRLEALGIRELRKLAVERGHKGAGRWPKSRLLAALQ